MAGNDTKVKGLGDAPVPKKGIFGLTAYLLAVTLFLFLGLYSYWPGCELPPSGTTANSNSSQISRANTNGSDNISVSRNTNGNVSQNSNISPNRNANGNINSNRNHTANGNTSQPPSSIKVLSVSPGSGPVSGDTWVTIKGSGFKEGAKVTFGGTRVGVEGIESLTSESVMAKTPSHDPGKVDVAVVNQDGSSDVLVSGYTYACPPVPGSRLLLIVILAGALGGTIHALRSLYWYVGNNDLVWSWVLMYIILPFSGAAIATVFFFIVRAGFISSPPDRETALYIIAIAAIAGLFSQQAALKLQDIANAVLTKPGEGSHPQPQTSQPVSARIPPPTPAVPPVPKIEPHKGPINGSQEVTISGLGFSSVKSVTFRSVAATDVKFDASTSTITAKTPKQTAAGAVDVVVTDDQGQSIKLKYTYE